ncbi:hypothetical protein ACFZDJ_30920 [Streptomyces sp. NPDC007896]|uniref:hypothetical protein n=1 Tax=Streptomyces sp. NPDC007896 TaxID=3364784 RepID=UPI0036E56254
MNPSGATAGGVAAVITALAHAPWPSIVGVSVGVTLIGNAQQLADAWNTLLRGVYERRALRSAEPAVVIEYFKETSTNGQNVTEPGD